MAAHLVHSAPGIDLSHVEPAETRRALRQLVQMLTARIEEQQTQIEALVELLVDRHVMSVGELKSALRRMQSRDDKAARVHSVLQSAQQPPRQQDLSANLDDMDVADDSVQRPNVYRL